MCNEGLSKIIGIGDVCLETNVGCKLLLKDVRQVPDMRLNLISTGKLDDEGFNNKFGDGIWKLTKSSLVVAKSKKTLRLLLPMSVWAFVKKFVSILWAKRAIG